MPRSLSLPSGLRVSLDDSAARAAAAMVGGSFLARAHGVLVAPGVVASPVAATELALRDAHVLAALLAWSHVVDEAPVAIPCENCGAEHRFSPSHALEIAPFVDAELDDPELDRAFDFEATHVVGASKRRIVLAPRTLGDAELLWKRDPARPLALTRAVVSALGVVAVGEERRASHIARMLDRADSSTWSDFCDLWDEAHHAARAFGTVRCDCGANVRAQAPSEHELYGRHEPRAHASGAVSLDADQFESEVARVAREVIRDKRAQGLVVLVDRGVPACDDGGEPLLGSYSPAGVDPDTRVETPPEVRLFYRTFENELRDIAGFDLSAEIRETIEHEVQHHLYDLAGDDPMDEEERAEIARNELARVGKRETLRREAMRQGSDLSQFIRATWPIFLVGALLMGLKYCI